MSPFRQRVTMWFLRTRLWHFILRRLVKGSQYDTAVPKDYHDFIA